jgi:hypothetical protein
MKRLYTVILLCGCVCFLLVAYTNNDDRLNEKPFSELKSEDVSNFIVTLRPPGEEFTVADGQVIAELVDLLREVTISEEDNSYQEYYGQWVEFRLTMTDGSSKTVVAYNPFIIIDGIGYKTEYEPCEKLNAFGNDLLLQMSRESEMLNIY